jgi:hypothetical protein
MPIRYCESNEMSIVRSNIVKFLEQQKAEYPDYKVIDVGGASNSWADQYVDAYVDIQNFNTDKIVFTGDICQPAIWDEIYDYGKFDFSICTHVLEDVRDPLFVAQGLMKISKAGFISMPNKHTELSNIESPFFLGYCHHRWIYSIQDSSELNEKHLVAMAKLPVINYWNKAINPLVRLIHLAGSNSFISKLNRRFGFTPAVAGIFWVNSAMVGKSKELGFQWQDEFDFHIINSDFAGKSILELSNFYLNNLQEGL